MPKPFWTATKLAVALLILAIGWSLRDPVSTHGWPGAGLVAGTVQALPHDFPFKPGEYGVAIILLGIASIFAALPKSVIPPSKPKPPAPSGPGTGTAASHSDDAVTPVATEIADASVMATSPTPLAAHPPPVEVLELPDLAPQPEAAAPPAALPVLEAEASEPTGDLEDQILAVRRRISTKDPTDRLAAMSELADLLKKAGDVADEAGQLPAAIAAYDESIVLRRKLVLARPDDVRQHRWLWITLECLADCREVRGHRSKAADLYRESLQTAERTVAMAPELAAYLADLQGTRARLMQLEAQLLA